MTKGLRMLVRVSGRTAPSRVAPQELFSLLSQHLCGTGVFFCPVSERRNIMSTGKFLAGFVVGGVVGAVVGTVVGFVVGFVVG